MSDIFISYRRQDSAAYAARLRADLALRYGADQVFLDIADLAPGRDFGDQLHQVVNACKSVLVVIGPQWATARDQTGMRRLDDPTDFIRAEIATALRAGKLVVPVLVGSARMPSPNELPGEIRGIALRQAGVLEDASWDQDLLMFYEVLDPLLGVVPRRPELALSPAARLPFMARLALAFDVLRGRGVRQQEELGPLRRPPSPKAASAASASAEIFVSYADEDRELADRIVQILEGGGHPCWIAHRDIPAGVPSWTGAVVAAIANSQLFVVLVTENSMSSRQVLREVTVADDENLAIIPLRFDNAALSDDLRYFFASTHRLDVASLPWEQAVQRIGMAVEQQFVEKAKRQTLVVSPQTRS